MHSFGREKINTAAEFIFYLLSFSSFSSVNNIVNENRPHMCLFDKSVLKEAEFHGLCRGG